MKTAVEWLEEQMQKYTWYDEDGFAHVSLDILDINQAKAMEKQQIMDAFEAAEKDCGRDFLHGDLYYNETFKSE